MLENSQAEDARQHHLVYSAYHQAITAGYQDLSKELTPEQKLWWACLTDAIKSAKLNHKDHAQEEIRWLLKSQSTKIGSFLWICNELNINPQQLRKKLKNNWTTLRSNVLRALSPGRYDRNAA